MRPFIAILLALALLSPAAAQEAGVLTTQGQGMVDVAPDLADIAIGIDSEGATPGEAIDANSASMARVIADAVRAGIAREDIQTGVLNLVRQSDEKRRRFYRVNNVATIRVRDMARLGAITRALVESGANDINGIRFGRSDAAKHRDAARREAVADARRKAEILAAAAGLRLGAILEITDVGFEGPGPVYGREAAMMRVDVPVEPGQVGISARVQIKWRLAP